jgi:hypothetical protein
MEVDIRHFLLNSSTFTLSNQKVMMSNLEKSDIKGKKGKVVPVLN